jgi:endonuclease IV
MNINNKEKDELKEYLAKTKIPLVIHGAYIDNPWNKKPGSVHNIKIEMRIAHEIGASGVIIHLGAGANDDDVLKYVLDSINKLDDDIKSDTILWLEINAMLPSENSFETPEKLAALFQRIDKYMDGSKSGSKDMHTLKIGIVVDTAHLYACGVSLATYDDAKDWFDELRRLLPHIPIMIHLNDCSSKLGSGIDKHELLTTGNIWRAYNDDGNLPIHRSGIVAVLQWAEKYHINVILERSREGALQDIILVNKLGFFSI